MEEILQRLAENFAGRMDGPLHFRFVVQPLMAMVFAIMDGCKDARNRRPAYFWALAVNPDHRKELLKDGWKHFGKIFILAIVLDVIYQIKVLHTVYPGEVLVVSLALAVLPYVLLRGPVNRIVRFFKN
jgi:hypothetical protein